MRYYNLILTNAAGQVYQPTASSGGFILGSGGSTFTSFVNGKTVPGALNIEFDLPVIPFNTPQGASIIRIWGVGLQMVGQAADLNGATFDLQAGMKPGLPLATAAAYQSGRILHGKVFQAFGNWEGPEQTIDLICNPGELAPKSGIAFDWAPGVPLNAALRTTFAQAFPDYDTPNIQISPDLQPPKGGTQCGWYKNIGQFAQYLLGITQAQGRQLTNASYAGVQITLIGNNFSIFDGTQAPPTPTQLKFQDIIGQPTWIAANTISFKTVLRSDIAVGSMIKFPTGVIAPYALTSPSAAVPGAPARSKTIFQGAFVVNEVHHFGNFRQPDAASWNTSFTAIGTGA